MVFQLKDLSLTATSEDLTSTFTRAVERVNANMYWVAAYGAQISALLKTLDPGTDIPPTP